MGNNSITVKERKILACKALIGEGVSGLAQEYETNREFVYQQKRKVTELLDNHFDVPESDKVVIALDKEMLRKTVLGCMVICKGSTEDTQEFIEKVYGIHIAIGSISNIVKEAAVKAKAFNQTINLNMINVGANDEIFQAGQPVLVGVDVYSTYIYLMQASDSREGDDWALALMEKGEQGLHLKESVNDGGTGLKKGLQDAFPQIQFQSDVFHAKVKLSLGVLSLERSAFKAISHEYNLQQKCLKSFEKNKDKHLSAYENAYIQSTLAIKTYDDAYTLCQWVNEALEKGGLSYEQRLDTLNYTLEQLSLIPKTNPYLEKGIKYISGHQEELLYFVKVAQEAMLQLAYEQQVEYTTIELLWQQMQYASDSSQYNIIESKIGNLLKNKYDIIRKKFVELLNKLVRASSIVECINSLLRPYLFLKRVAGERFLDLLQCYFNTRKYQRSRVPSRVGQSPIELLTGHGYPDFLEILGY